MTRVCENHPSRAAETICFSCKGAYCRECLSVGGDFVYCNKAKCIGERDKQRQVASETTQQNIEMGRAIVVGGLEEDAKLPFPKFMVSIRSPVLRRNFQIRIIGMFCVIFLAWLSMKLSLISLGGFFLGYIVLLSLVAIQAAKRQRARLRSPWWAITCFLNPWWAGIFLIFITLKRDGIDELVTPN